MAVNINVPSQVRTFANLAAFPATGALKTIYIAEDTNKTYRWTGSVYVEVSASASGITIGTTAIASGVVGRVLFEGAGNVVQESANLFWDATNNRLGIGTSTPLRAIDVFASSPEIATRIASNGTGKFSFLGNAGGEIGAISLNGSSGEMRIFTSFTYFPTFYSSGSEAMRIATTGNVLINTTTDAGFKLDVNGTARVQGQLTTSVNQNNPTRISLTNTTSGTLAGTEILLNTHSGALMAAGKVSNAYTPYKTLAAGDGYLYNTTFGDISLLNDFATGRIKFAAGGASTSQMTLFSTGNLGINTTTDAGFRLDVNGTARVSNGITTTGADSIINTTTGLVRLQKNGADYVYINNDGFALRLLGAQVTMNPTLGVSIGALYDLSGNYAGYRGVNIRGTWTLNLSNSPEPSARLQADSTTQGFLPPRMTTTQKNAIATPATGLQVYDTTLNQMSYYNGTTWTNI